MNAIQLQKLPKQLKPGFAIVELDEKSGEQKTASGIIIPTENPFVNGKIVQGHKLETFDLEDTVYFRKDLGTKLQVGSKTYVYTTERDFFFSV